jgi:hypothetical protein
MMLPRCEFNKPFSCIALEPGPASTVLPTLSWKQRTILWLDYTDMLDDSVLADIAFACGALCSGSVIIITVNAHPQSLPGKSMEENAAYRLTQLKGRILTKLRLDLTGDTLGGWGLAKESRRIITNEIQEVLTTRNGNAKDEDKLLFSQLYNFHYSDRAKMCTFGGIIYSHAERAEFERCDFDELEFVRQGTDAFEIEVPDLTFREIRHLDKSSPRRGKESMAAPGVSSSEIAKFLTVYRYFPSFTEAEL